MSWLGLALAIIFEILGTLSLKQAATASKRWYLAVVAGYGISYAFLAMALADIPLGVAYGIWSGVGVVAMAILGRLIFKERLTWVMGLGIVLITGGVVLIQLGSTA